MSDNPLFSVLIANYNNGQYLQEAIDNVLVQTYANWEVVIVDDGSTDKSQEVYNRYANDSRFRVFYNGENKGCGYTKRRCVDFAKGDICGFLDADDVLLPDALESHVATHKEHTEISLVFSRFYYCDQGLNIVNELRKLEIEEGKNYFTNRNYLPEHFASFKKECYMKTEGISEQLPAAVDQDLYFKLEEVAPVFLLDKFTYKYRTTPAQLSQGDNWVSTLYWNLVVRRNTCIRRHLREDDYPIKDLTDIILSLQMERDCVQKELERTRATKAFRLGKFLLHPFKKYK